MDMGFNPLASKMSYVTVNMEEAHEHVKQINIETRVLKERGKSTLNKLPFGAVPKRVIIELVYFTALWLNDSP